MSQKKQQNVFQSHALTACGTCRQMQRAEFHVEFCSSINSEEFEFAQLYYYVGRVNISVLRRLVSSLPSQVLLAAQRTLSSANSYNYPYIQHRSFGQVWMEQEM